MLLNKEEYKAKLEQLIDKSKSINERVALIAESLDKINPIPDLSTIVSAISSDDEIMKKAYKSVCEDIKGEVFVLLNQINDKRSESVKIEVDLWNKEKEKNKYCSIYAKVPPLQDLKDGAEYKYFLERYEQGVRLSQEVSELQLKVVQLMDVQRVLDDAFAGSMIEVDYLIRRLNDAVKMFKYFKTPDLLQSYKDRYCTYKDLQKMVNEKNEEWEAMSQKLTDTKSLEIKQQGKDRPA